VIFDVKYDATRELNCAQALLEDVSRLIYKTLTIGNLDSIEDSLDTIYAANENIGVAQKSFLS
jgi:hypothetical protein